MAKGKDNSIYFFVIVGVILLVAGLMKTILYYIFTSFEKTITVKDKYTRYRRNGSNYNVVDTNNEVYQLDNLWFKGDFDRAEDYNILEKGKKYKVKGYGLRLPIFDSYKRIYSIKLL